MSGTTKNYEEAMRKYRELNEQNTQSALDINKVATERAQRAIKRATESAIGDQNKFLDNLENRDLFEEAYNKGSRAAAGQAAAQGAQTQAAARQAGISKAAAAEMGAQASNNAYANALAQQQGMAQGAIGQKLGMQQSGINQKGGLMMQGAGQEANLGMQGAAQRMGTLQNQVSNQQTAVGMGQNLDQMKWDQGWGAASKAFGAAGELAKGARDWMDFFDRRKDKKDGSESDSDIRLKDATKTNATDVDAILKKYQKPKSVDFRKLILEDK